MTEHDASAGTITLACEPARERQAHEAGLFLLWRDAPGAGRRQGLAFTASACPEPDCACRDVHLDGVVIDDRAVRVSWTDTALDIVWPMEAAPEDWTARELEALVDLESGEVRWREPDPREEDRAGGEPDAELLGWVQGAVDGELLEQLQRLWLDGKGHPRGGLRPDIDLYDLAPGQLVGFDELFDDERGDLYPLGDGAYWADTRHCVDPGCRCRDALVTFSDAGQPGRSVGSVVVELHPRGGGKSRVKEQRSEDGAPRRLVNELWSLFSRRHRVTEYLRRRDARVKAADLGPHLPYGQRGARSGARGPGRNEPCPCGSGKKYKRCCLGKK